MRLMSGGLRAAALGGSAFPLLSLSPFLWLDPSDLSTLFQDAAMTTPVTANNDPVGAILDKSGNGRHLTQGTAGSRPLYKTSGGLHWLEFDGSDDSMTVVFALSQPWDRMSAIRQLSWTNGDRIFAPNSGQGAGFLWQTPNSPDLSFFDGTNTAPTNSNAAVAADVVVTERHNGASSRLAIDNGAYATGDPGTTSLNGLSLGGETDSISDGHFRLYGVILFDRLLTDSEIARLRAYYAAKQGRAL